MVDVLKPSELLAKFRKAEDYLHDYCFQELCKKIKSELTFNPTIFLKEVNNHLRNNRHLTCNRVFPDLIFTANLSMPPERFDRNIYNVHFTPRRLCPMFAKVGYELRTMQFKNQTITCQLWPLIREAPPPYEENLSMQRNVEHNVVSDGLICSMFSTLRVLTRSKNAFTTIFDCCYKS